MQSEYCLKCYYWDYIDDTSESNAKICYYSVEASPEHPAACLSAEEYPDNK